MKPSPPITPPPDLDDLIVRALHGLATPEEREELSRRLAASADSHERFIDHANLHAALIGEARAGAFAANPTVFFDALQRPAPSRRFRFRWLPAAAAALIVGMVTLTVVVWPVRASAALNRVIQAMDQSDRAYQIEVLDDGGDPPQPARADRGPYPPGAFLDGAKLYLRGRDQFVFEQRLPNGETRVMGSDGLTSWSLRSRGPVHVSTDASRFGGGVLAGREDLAFLNLRSQVEELRQFYQLEWSDAKDAPAPGLRGLHGIRRDASRGGAKEIELWFEPATGLIRRMVCTGLPRNHGGPASVAINLNSAAALPPDFFSHKSHHEPDRPVETE